MLAGIVVSTLLYDVAAMTVSVLEERSGYVTFGSSCLEKGKGKERKLEPHFT